jgi:phosphoglycerate dehydrogenase-like enzyme
MSWRGADFRPSHLNRFRIRCMAAKATVCISVVCSLSKQAEFAEWITRRVSDDRLLSRRVDFHVPLDDASLGQALAGAEVYATFRFSEQALALAPRLKWLHLGLAGVDSAMFPAMKRSKIIVTSSRGLHDETVPQAAWAFVLSFATGLHEGYRQKQEHRWDRKAIVLARPRLSRQRMLVVGTGRIGSGIARIAKQAGMEVWGIRRSKSAGTQPHFDRVMTQRGMSAALGEADYVVLAMPGGEATEKLIGAAELKQMKPAAYLINIARGSVVDEEALVDALRENRIAGAGLDVFAHEPLPDNHPFYSLPNVALTPHTSGDTADYPYRAAELFLSNLRRYQSGRPLLNVVDKRKGY